MNISLLYNYYFRSDNNSDEYVFSDEYTNILNFAASNLIDHPSDDIKMLQDLYLRYKKDIGEWDLMDRIWVVDKTNSLFALIDWKSPDSSRNLININSTTWGVNGFTGNAGNMRLRSQFIPISSGVNYIQNNSGIIVRHNKASVASTQSLIGGSSLTDRDSLNIITTGIGSQINSSTASNQTYAPDKSGLLHLKRTGSSSVQVFKNGTQILTNAVVSSGLPSQELWILAYNFGGNPINQSDATVGLIEIGASANGLESAISLGDQAYANEDLQFFTDYFS